MNSIISEEGLPHIVDVPLPAYIRRVRGLFYRDSSNLSTLDAYTKLMELYSSKGIKPKTGFDNHTARVGVYAEHV